MLAENHTHPVTCHPKVTVQVGFEIEDLYVLYVLHGLLSLELCTPY